MRLLRAACVACPAAVALLVLAGCTNDEPSPREPVSSATSSGSPSSPTSSATSDPVEPELPEAATKATEEGARAFIAYYFDLISYAQETGDVRALKAASGKRCDGCNAGIDGIEEHYRTGGTISGGALRVRISRITELSTDSDNLYGFHAVATSNHDEQTVTSSDGSTDVRSAGTNGWDLYLLWTSRDRWRLDVMDLK